MLKDRIAVVTGAGNGIGAAIAESFVKENAAGVAIVDYDFEAACKEAEKLGAAAFPVKCDVSNGEEVEKASQQILERYGHVDILVNNAGITRDSMFHKMSFEKWDAVMKTNLYSVFYWCNALIGQMRAQEYGRIINMSSAAVRGNVGQCNYAAAKAAMIGFTTSLAKESGRKNITVNCVAPGSVNTSMYLAVPDEVMQASINACPMRRLGEPKEVADLVTFLASDKATFISGQWIVINGGK